MDLLALPDHILAKILSHIPGHFEVASVCKKFYEIDCYNHRKNLRFSLGSYDDSDYSKIMESKRIFHGMSLHICARKTDEFESVINRHGSSIKKLRLYDVIGEKRGENLLKILKNFPKLESLSLSMSMPVDLFKTKKLSGNKPKTVPIAKEVLELPKLRRLETNIKSIPFISGHFLMTNLKDLEIDGISEDETLAEFLKNHLSIEMCKIRAENAHLLENQMLTSLSFHNYRFAPVVTKQLINFFKTQLNLKQLDLGNVIINEELAHEIGKLKNLGSLTFESFGYDERRYGSFCIEMISKLANLKTLQIGNLPEKLMKKMSLIKNLPLESLTLYNTALSKKVLQNFGKNFKLKSFSLLMESNFSINDIMKSLPSLEILVLTPWNVPNAYERDGNKFESLRSLEIHPESRYREDLDPRDFFKMLGAPPNLEYLKIPALMMTKQFFVEWQARAKNIQELEIRFFYIKAKKLFCAKAIQVFQQMSKSCKKVKIRFYVHKIKNSESFDQFANQLQGYFKIRTEIDFSEYSFLTISKN